MRMAKIRGTGESVLVITGPVEVMGQLVYLTLEVSWCPRLRVRPTHDLELV